MNEKSKDIATGIIKIHPRGFGFLQPEEKDLFQEDIFIPRHATKGAVDGDFVEAAVQESPKGFEGRIVKIIKRGRLHVAGTVALKVRHGAYAYVPLLGEEKLMRITGGDAQDLQRGDRIIIKVLDWGSERRESSGEMSYYIGHITDPSCDIAAAVEEFELDDAFSTKALSEAKEWGTQVAASDFEGRTDLSELPCMTIDPETAKDFDDALSIKITDEGNYFLGVHIADVSHYVKSGSQLDNEAKARCNSVYFPGFVLPMLPHELSSHLCSLKPNVHRLALTVFMTFDQEGNLLDYQIMRSVIKSKKRFSYKEAKEILDGSKKSKYSKDLFLMVDLCHRLKGKRNARGSIDFALPDIRLHVDKQGFAEKVEIIEYDITHQLVEEFMLKANEVVATHLAKQGKPLTFRVHEEPNVENIKDFCAMARALGFKISDTPTSEELQNLFDSAKESPFGQFLSTAFIRSMKLATYSTQNIGHYGLGLTHYTHFTSPIRRYIDLIVHRVLMEELSEDQNLNEIAQLCSEKERLAAKAENSVVALKKLRLIERQHAENPTLPYNAVITSVKPFGFGFTLVDLLYDGFLPLSAIDRKGSFYFDEKKKRLKVKNMCFQTGDKLEVFIKSINLITQQTEWSLTLPRPEKRPKFRKRK